MNITSSKLVLILLSLSVKLVEVHGYGQKVLALFEDVAYSTSYSQYLNLLEQQGYSIEQRSALDPNLHLREWDNWKYDKLIIFASGINGFGGALDPEGILDFVDAGNDLILAVDSRVSDEIRNLVSDLGIDLEPQGSAVIDTTNHVVLSKALDSTLITSSQLLQSPAILGESSIREAVLFRGIGATIAADSEQVISILSGEKTHVMSNPSKAFTEDWQKTGKGISLFSAGQTRNDARVIVAGSLDAFSNTFLQATEIRTKGGEKYTRSGNEQFLLELTKWAFKQRSVLRATNLRHHPPNETRQPDRYRITDEIVFEIDIHELRDGQWKPYKASDVQVEFVMLDPHIRTFLQHDGKGRYFTQFKIPDVYGVFKFVIDYRRPGLTPLLLSQQIQIRHFKHNEFERFIVAAYPYYTSAFSCMVAFLIFSFVFLYHKDK